MGVVVGGGMGVYFDARNGIVASLVDATRCDEFLTWPDSKHRTSLPPITLSVKPLHHLRKRHISKQYRHEKREISDW